MIYDHVKDTSSTTMTEVTYEHHPQDRSSIP